LLYHLPGATGIGFLGSMKSYENCGLTKFHKHLSIDASISSLCYSPQPDGCSRPHLATGLTTGEVKVFEPLSGPLFTLQHPVDKSAVTSIAYSRDGKTFVVGHENGELHFWRGNKLTLYLCQYSLQH